MDKNKRERQGAHQREVFLFNDLLLVTKSVQKRIRKTTNSLSTAGSNNSTAGAGGTGATSSASTASIPGIGSSSTAAGDATGSACHGNTGCTGAGVVVSTSNSVAVSAVSGVGGLGGTCSSGPSNVAYQVRACHSLLGVRLALFETPHCPYGI
ncbi:unnamed protein product, partial [Protopolystoma xenopodis]